MQSAEVEEEIFDADQAFQQLRDLSQALEARLQARQFASLHPNQHHAQHPGRTAAAAAEPDGNSSREAADQQQDAAAVPGPLEQQLSASTQPGLQEHLSAQAAAAAGLQSCGNIAPESSFGDTEGACTSITSASASSSHLGVPAASHKQQQVPLSKQHAQLERQTLQAQRKQAAAEAAARNRQQLAQGETVSRQAAQQQLPFQVQHSQVSSSVQHKLQKTLSMILGSAADRRQAQAKTSVAAPASVDSTRLAVGSIEPVSAVGALEAAQGPSASSTAAAASADPMSSSLELLSAGTRSSPCRHHDSSTAGAAVAQRQSQHARSCSIGELPVQGHNVGDRRSSTSRPAISTSGSSKRQVWAAADAQTDAEVNNYLLEHWQQHHLATAALVLQCAWRSRVARLAFGRYMSKRHASVQAALQPAFHRWRCWAKAAAHSRWHQQQAVLWAWRELLQLQTQLCVKVIKGLQGGALAGDMPTVIMWRLCNSSAQQIPKIRPSLGGMLASIMLHRVPQMRKREYLLAWRQLTQSQALLRVEAHRMLTAVLREVERQRLQQAVRFWRLYTASCICERLKLQLPTFPHHCNVFDAWLWRHERRQYMQQQAVGLAGRLGVVRCFVLWHGHVHKMRVMRAAWSGLLLHTPEELLRGGMSAFKANWREEVLHRRLLTTALLGWRQLVDRNKAVAAVRKRIKSVEGIRCKVAGLTALRRFCKMSQLLSAAGVLKQWQARPLMLAHIHAWLHETLHATFYLCWWRWRRRAVARLRLRAALGLHMYRAHWLQLELVFCGWRKVAAVAKQQQQQQQQQGPADSAGTGLDQQQEAPADKAMLSASSSITSSAAEAGNGGCSDTEDCVTEEEEPMVHVSLADYPVVHPWRPLLQRKAVLAPQGLRRLTGLRLGRAVKDLRELEGGFVAKDHDSGAGSLLSSRVFARSAVSPGLKAMATAQLPMDLLWRKSFPADRFWWQRIVGLVQQLVPHPDNWRALLISPHSTSSSSSSGPCADATCKGLQDFLSARHSSATYKCTCSRCLHYVDPKAAVVIDLAEVKRVDAAASMARARLRLRAGLKLNPLQVPAASTAVSTAAATPVAASAAGDAASSCAPDSKTCTDAGGCNGRDSSMGGATSSNNAADTGTSSNANIGDGSSSSSSSLWPAGWTCEDVAGLCRLAQAEELLETAVHQLLGIGADSSTELYEKLQQMTRGIKLPMQGDLLAWLLSAALAQDSAHSCSVLSRARARDELLIATMELTERAMALHLHIPHKFTLNTKRERVDVRASWGGVISRVEQERDWEASSSEDDALDPQEQLWASLLSQHHQQQQPSQQPQQSRHGQTSDPGTTAFRAGRPHSATAAAAAAAAAAPAHGTLLPQRPGAAQQQQQSPQAGGRVAGSVEVSAGPNGAQAAVMALAAAAAGPRARASAMQEHLAPGMMLAQSPIPASELWRSEHASRAHTPGLEPSSQPQHALQQQLDAEQQTALEKQRQQQQEAKQKQQRQQKQAKAAALFGSKTAAAAGRATSGKAQGKGAAAAAAAAAAGDGASVTAEAEIFTGPDFLPLASLASSLSSPNSNRSKASTNQSHTEGQQAAPGQEPPLLRPGQQTAPLLHQSSASMADNTASGSGVQQLPGSGSTPETPPAAAAAAAAAAAVPVDLEGVASDEVLKSELENILTELLAPLLPSAELSTGVAPRPVAGDGPGNQVISCLRGDGTSGDSASILYGARSAAQCLAGACAEWALQQEQSALLDGTVSMQPAKALSAPSSLHDGLPDRPRSSCSSRDSREGLDSSNSMLAAALLQHSVRQRPASASGNLQPSRAGTDVWPGTAAAAAGPARVQFAPNAEAQLNGELDDAFGSSSGLGGGFGSVDGQEPSWLALAVQQGLIDPIHPSVQAAAQQRILHSQEHSEDGGLGGAIGTAGGEQLSAEQSSSQENPSSCSSLPSIPSGRSFWDQQQQQQQRAQQKGKGKGIGAGSPVAAKVPKGACEVPVLPRIPAAMRHFRSSAPGGLQHQLAGSGRLGHAHTQDSFAQELLPQVAAALQALQDLQSPQQLSGSTQQELLQGMQQALTLLEPAQLQQQVQLLLHAQRQSAAARAQQLQQQERGVVRIVPWGGEMQPPEPVGSGGVPVGLPGSGASGAAAVLSHLLTASLSTRVAFWRQVTIKQPQQGDVRPYQPEQQYGLQQQYGLGSVSSSTPLSDQLHQLAWSSILISSSTKRQRQQDQQQQWQQLQQQQHADVGGEGPLAELKQKLHTYLAAHMQWRQQQQYAAPLAPEEKWVTLEHEEQVLEFITSMTIAVHQQLLRKHLGMPATQHQHPSSAAFGSSASRDTTSTATAAEAAASAAQEVAEIKAHGSRVDMSKARRILPTSPLRAPAKVVPVYVIPRPDVRGGASLALTARQSRLTRDRLEPLQGWQTADEHAESLCLLPGDAYGQQTPPSQRGAGRWPGCERRGPGAAQTLKRGDSSFKSSESSWARS